MHTPMTTYRSAGRGLQLDEIRAIAPSVFATGAHESRSARYNHIPTYELLAPMAEAGFMPVEVQQAKTRVEGKRGFTKHMVKFTRTDANLARETIPQVMLVNSHDGSSSYHLIAGIIRSFCWNGLICGTFESIKIPHFGKVTGNVIEGAFEVISQSQRAIEHIEDWRAIKLDYEQRNAYTASAARLRFDPVKQAFDTAALQGIQRIEDNADDLWTVYNRVQEHLVRGGTNYNVGSDGGKRGRWMRSKAIRSIDGQIKLNRDLWNLTEEFSKLAA